MEKLTLGSTSIILAIFYEPCNCSISMFYGKEGYGEKTLGIYFNVGNPECLYELMTLASYLPTSISRLAPQSEVSGNLKTVG